MAELNKTDKSFKILINKRFTSDADRNQGRQFYQENGADTINVHAREVWTNPVPTNPNDALTDGIAKYHDKFILTPDPVVGSSNTTQQAWFFQSGSGFTISAPVATPTTKSQFTLVIPATTSSAYSFNTAVYDIELVNAGITTRLLQGKIKLSKEVTR